MNGPSTSTSTQIRKTHVVSRVAIVTSETAPSIVAVNCDGHTACVAASLPRPISVNNLFGIRLRHENRHK